MKRSIMLFLAIWVVLLCGATNRFFIEDFEISPGESLTVNILLDNDVEFTAFQADIYLPDGLTIEQDDGDFIFDLTPRKARDHNIASHLQSDGSIRIMSYSPGINPYSGNSGALVSFNVTAATDFNEPESIQLKNILFTTTAGNELSFSDETTSVTPRLLDLTGRIMINSQGDYFKAINPDNMQIDKYYTYSSVEISYTSNEDVNYSILVNGCVILDEGDVTEDFINAIEWNEQINGFIIDLYELSSIESLDDYGYCSFYDIEVTLSANGYKSLSSHESIVSYTEPYGCSAPSIETNLTDYSLIINLLSEMSGSILLVNGEPCELNYAVDDPYYVIERTSEDINVALLAASKTIGMPYYILSNEININVPPISNGISISQCDGDYEQNCVYVAYYGDTGNSTAALTVSINDYNVVNNYDSEDSFQNECVVNLLNYAEHEYGGVFHIRVIAEIIDGYSESHYLYADTTLEYYMPIEPPTIETTLTPTSLIIDVNSSMSNILLIVDGDMGASGPGEDYQCRYEVMRTDEDYYISVKAGHRPMYYSDFVWTDDISILVPAILRGDVDGNESVTISDVTALIDYLLNGNSQSICIENADVNRDERISITDVTALIDFLLSGKWPEPVVEDAAESQSFTVNGVNFRMIRVDGGAFNMGATPDQGENPNEDEKPMHQVVLSDYYIGQTEVTQELWQAVMESNPSRFNNDINKPVEKVSWNQCQEFIFRLNDLTGQQFRLPSEAEWEFAARGGTKSKNYTYSGGNDLNDLAWYNYNAYAVGSSSPDYGTHVVGTRLPNELGLYDMTGNVWEWCQDWYGSYSAENQTDPTGPETGSNHVIRGGGWTNYPSLLRIAARSNYLPTFTGNFIGLRLAL